MALDLEAVAGDVLVPLRPQDDLGLEPEVGPEPETERPLRLLQTAIAAGLGTAAAAWMVGGVFRGWEPRAIGLAAAAVGAAMGYAVFRLRRPALQLVVPIAATVIGAALAAPAASAGTGVPALVVDAIRSGGFLQPPVDFAPGWVLILFVLFTVLSAGALGVAVGRSRPPLAAVVPLPLALGAALVQPPGAALTSSVVTIIAILAAVAVAFGADLGRGGAGDNVDAGFEGRRLARAGGMVAGLVIVVLAVNQAGFLFPSPDQNRVVPPQRPRVPPNPQDVPLFRVTTNAQAPYRLGVIDVYDVKQGAWMLPEQDNRRLQRKSAPASLPGPPLGQKNLTATFVVEQASGHLLPVIGEPVRVTGLPGQQFDYDPRQNTMSLAGRPVFRGLTYTVETPSPATGDQLRHAGPAPRSITDQYLAAPTTPLEVRTLLGGAPTTNNLDRLQFVRQAFYNKVVAAGAGQPTDVSAKRAVEVMQGAEANPYEIAATEALLARWAGIPARIGYGYYGGDPLPGGSTEIRPKNGATWLEVYFGQYGWIPIVGTPPRAKPSTSQASKNPNPQIRATNDLALVVYLPVRDQSLLPLYVILRYWLLVSLPFVLAAVALLVFHPDLVKRARTWRRRRWARVRGPQVRIATAYAEFRDTCRDLAIGDPLATPLEFIDYVEPDKAHRELAWLVTRALYGDIQGARLTDETAHQAEQYAASVTRRIIKAQSLSTRVLALAARTSLRDPYSTQVPNLWWRPARPRLRRMSGAAAAAAVAVLLAGCASPKPAAARPLPSRLVPQQLGTLTFVEETKAEGDYKKGAKDPAVLVDQGRIFTLHRGEQTEGSVQVARFKPGFSGADPEVRRAITNAIGTVADYRGARLPAWLDSESDQRIYLWFPPRSDSMVLLVLRRAFTAPNADAVANALINYQAGGDAPATLQLKGDQEPPSPPPTVLPAGNFSASGS